MPAPAAKHLALALAGGLRRGSPRPFVVFASLPCKPPATG
jgi:hypothetical protein